MAGMGILLLILMTLVDSILASDRTKFYPFGEPEDISLPPGDDTYSGPIHLSQQFPFYGTKYNSLQVSS